MRSTPIFDRCGRCAYTPPQNNMPFPFRIRSLLVGWNMLFFEAGRYAADASRLCRMEPRRVSHARTWALRRVSHAAQFFGGRTHGRGADRRGAIWTTLPTKWSTTRSRRWTRRTVRSWSAANLTPAPSGLGAWSLDDIAAYLKTGHSARAGAFGPMSEVIGNSTSRLTDQDVRAIAVYLKSLPPATQRRSPSREPTSSRPARSLTPRDAATAICRPASECRGAPMPMHRRRLPRSPAMPPCRRRIRQPSSMSSCTVRTNLPWPTSPWPRMSGFELSVGLDDAQIAALCTYVRSSWGNHAGAVDSSAVGKQH